MKQPIRAFTDLLQALLALGLLTAGCSTGELMDGEDVDSVAQESARSSDGQLGESALPSDDGADCESDRSCDGATGSCKTGDLTATLCADDDAPDVVMRAALRAPSEGDVTSVPFQFGPGCDDFVVHWQNPEEARWWDRLVAYVPAESRPDTRCACENLELMVEVEELACVTEGCFAGSCTDGGACCHSSECGEGEACIGATPVTSSLCATSTATRTARGKFVAGFGCVLSLTIERDDAEYGLAFRGIAPRMRAQAIDTLSGAHYPVTIAGHND